MTTVPSTRGPASDAPAADRGTAERSVPGSAHTQGSGERTVRRSPGSPALAELPFGTGRVEFATFGSFQLESGDVLPELPVAFRHDGPPPSDAPQVLVVHA